MPLSLHPSASSLIFFFFQAEDGIRDIGVTGVQTCALPISRSGTGAAPCSTSVWGSKASSRPTSVLPSRNRARTTLPLAACSQVLSASSASGDAVWEAVDWGTLRLLAMADLLGLTSSSGRPIRARVTPSHHGTLHAGGIARSRDVARRAGPRYG